MNLGKGETPSDSDFPEEMKCSICTELMDEPTALIPCMHTFCKKCIDLWMTKAKTCPMCNCHV